MTSADWDFVASTAKNAATKRATCLARKICSGPPEADVGRRIAGHPPATAARLRITLWRRSSRWRWRGALIQIRRRRRRRAKIKLHRWRFLRARLRSEKWSRRKTEHSRDQVCRETAHCHVVVLHGCVEVPALDRDPVLRAFQLRLQTNKILISF